MTAASDQAATEILRVSRVSKMFGVQTVLDELDLAVCAGENLAIIGKSGTGKSVLLRIINGLMPPDGGTLLLWGQLAKDLTEDEWVPLRRRMGMVFQSGALFDSMTVFENIAFPLREREALAESEIRDLVEERLEWVELPGVGEQYPSELSGGMRRRVALARTIAVAQKVSHFVMVPIWEQVSSLCDLWPKPQRKFSCANARAQEIGRIATDRT